MDKKALTALVLTANILLAYSVPNKVEAKTARCYLAINGTTYINGQCSFEFSDWIEKGENEGGSFDFSDMKQKIRCENPSQRPGQCPMSEIIILKNGIFGSLRIISPGKGKVYWNGGTALQQDGAFPVTRNGACWVSSTVKLCAW